MDIVMHVIGAVEPEDERWRVAVTMRSVSTLARAAAIEWARCTTSVRLDVSFGRSMMSTALAAVRMCSHLRHLQLRGPCIYLDVARAFFRTCDDDEHHRRPTLEVTHVDVTRCLRVVGVESLVASCPYLSHVNLSEGASVVDADVAAVATHCGTRLERLELQMCKRLTDASLVSVAAHCPNLTYVDVSGCSQLSDVGIRELAHSCTKLVHVDVRMCFGGVSDRSLLSLSRHCPALAHVAFQRSRTLKGSGVRALATRCTQLVHVQLVDCGGLVAGLRAMRGSALTSLDVRGCRGVDDACIVAIVHKCTALTSLAVQRCDDVSDASMVCVATHCTQLVHLDVEHCDVGDVGVEAVVRQCKKLSRLYVRGCRRVSDVFAIARHCATLERLTCPPFTTDAGLGALGEQCTSLSHLYVTSCDVVAEGLVACAQNGKLTHLTCPSGTSDATLCTLARLSPRLQEVNLLKCFEGQHRRGVTDVGIAVLVEQCTHLKRTMLPATVTDVGVGAIVSKCGRSLELLDVSRCALSSTSMSAIAQHCPRLTYLSCGQMSDSSVDCIARECTELVHLLIAGSFEGVSDVGVLSLVHHAARLATLKLPSCAGITDVGISALRGCGHLTAFAVEDWHKCPNITRRCVHELRTALPHLQVYVT